MRRLIPSVAPLVLALVLTLVLTLVLALVLAGCAPQPPGPAPASPPARSTSPAPVSPATRSSSPRPSETISTLPLLAGDEERLSRLLEVAAWFHGGEPERRALTGSIPGCVADGSAIPLGTAVVTGGRDLVAPGRPTSRLEFRLLVGAKRACTDAVAAALADEVRAIPGAVLADEEILGRSVTIAVSADPAVAPRGGVRSVAALACPGLVVSRIADTLDDEVSVVRGTTRGEIETLLDTLDESGLCR